VEAERLSRSRCVDMTSGIDAVCAFAGDTEQGRNEIVNGEEVCSGLTVRDEEAWWLLSWRT
jgi:hypothetical protein